MPTKKTLVPAATILGWMNEQNPTSATTIATIEELERDVVDSLESCWNRTLREETKTIIFDAEESPHLLLPERLTSLTSPVPSFRSRLGVGEEWEAEDAGIYEYEDTNRGMSTIVTRTDGNVWYPGNNTTEVTGKVGYKQSNLPGDVRRLIMEMCAGQFRDRVRTTGRIGADDATQVSPLSAASQRTMEVWQAPRVELTTKRVRRLTLV